MTGTITLIGCSLTDEVFETDESIVGEAMMWNITAIRRDADAGKFGPPIRRPMSVLPAMAAAHTANIDWRKVLRYEKCPTSSPSRSSASTTTGRATSPTGTIASARDSARG